MKNKFLMILLSCVIFSCSNEDNFIETQQVGEQPTRAIEEPIPIVNSFEDLYKLSGIKAEPQSPTILNKLQTKDLALLTTTGYSRITETRSQKAMFTKDFALKMGLDPYMVYFYNWIFVEKDVNPGGKMLFMADSPECGMTPIINDTYQEVTSWDTRGYKVLNSGNPTVFKTHVFFVEYDTSGKRLDKYFPTTPSNLKWNYYIY